MTASPAHAAESPRNDTPTGGLRAARMVLFCGVLLAVLAIIFRMQITNGFTHLFGDRGDAVIEAALLEHWFNVVRGLARWSQPNYFYPYDGVLGYNDGYFLYGLIYSVFRAAGFDPLLASELLNVVIRAIGFGAFFLALRRILDIPFGWALFGAALFGLNHSSFLHSWHAQLLTVAFLPVFWLLAAETLRAMATRPGTRSVALWGAGTAVFYAAWLLTAYYMAWFTGLFTLIFCVALAAATRTAGMRVAARAIAANARPLLLVMVVAAAALAPFLVTYLPKARETGMHAFFWVRYYTPSALDLVNVGTDNWMFGRYYIGLARYLCPGCAQTTSELTTGFAPVLLALFLCACIRLWQKPKLAEHDMLARLTAIAIVASLALSIHIGPYTGWYAVYHLIPGAKGLRVVARFEILLMAPIATVVVYYLARIGKAVPRPITALLAGLLLLGEINTGQASLDRPAELARIDVPDAPPAACRAFYVASEADIIDAMLVAERINLPTINGVASLNPPDWISATPTDIDYNERVRRYAAAHAITGLCRLDLSGFTWTGPER